MDNLKMNKVNTWVKMVQKRNEWKIVVEKAKTLAVDLKNKQKKKNYVSNPGRVYIN